MTCKHREGSHPFSWQRQLWQAELLGSFHRMLNSYEHKAVALEYSTFSRGHTLYRAFQTSVWASISPPSAPSQRGKLRRFKNKALTPTPGCAGERRGRTRLSTLRLCGHILCLAPLGMSVHTMRAETEDARLSFSHESGVTSRDVSSENVKIQW